ncbi:MAG: shikimate kinase [Luteimonas sp.]
MDGAANLVLVGPMGSGKSVLGKRLAASLGLRFADADEELERQAGSRIDLIFETEGESGFRLREREVLERLLADGDQVIATGGGAVLDPGNRERIGKHGFVVWLQAGVESQLQRLAADLDRPLLRDVDRRATLLRLTAERAPFYAEVADLAFDTDLHSERAAGDALLALVQSRWHRATA